MADELSEAVELFLDDADDALDEYEQGYMDADAALSLLDSYVDDLRDEYDDLRDERGD